MHIAKIRTLELEGELLFDLKSAVVHQSGLIVNRSEDGLLPTSLFDTIIFLNDKHEVILNPKVNQ